MAIKPRNPWWFTIRRLSETYIKANPNRTDDRWAWLAGAERMNRMWETLRLHR